MVVCCWLALQPVHAALVMFHGKVVLEDGSPVGVKVAIERSCYGMDNRLEVITDKTGQYSWHVDADPYSAVTLARCVLLASLKGYMSSTIDLTDPHLSSNPQLPALVLSKIGSDPGLKMSDDGVPRRAQKAWDLGLKALQAKKWFEAERQLGAAVEAAPRFAPGWSALGMALENEEKFADARQAFEKSIALDPKDPLPYYRLTHLQMADRDWQTAARTADSLIRMDTRHRYLNVLIDYSVIRYHLGDLEGAEANLNTALRLDKRHELTRAEYVLGMILEAKKDYAAAGEHMRQYLKLEPKAPDAAAVEARLENLGKPQSADVAPELDVVLPNLPAGEEAWVPGGFKAFAAIAHIQGTPTYSNFFLEYCRAVARETAPANGEAVPDFAATIQAFIASVSELTRLGEQKGDVSVVTLSLATEAQRKKAEKILPLLGWKMVQEEGPFSIEPGDHPTDVLRQPIPAALGIDEITMQETLAARQSFSFEIPSETARLENAAAWSEVMRGFPTLAGGIAELFARDVRTARTYAGLGAMEHGAAEAVLKSIGLRVLVNQDSNILSLYSEAFALSKGTVALPGGPDSHAAWQKLAGASPFDPPAFLRNVIEKDRGTLAAFYFAVSRADAAHQRFLTRTGERAESFYNWYRHSSDLYLGMEKLVGTWRPAFFRDLPLDDAGNVRFPGGKRAWSAAGMLDDDSLLNLDSLEALVPLTQLEEKRKAPLDEASASLLSAHYADWKNLFPYFESLPGLGGAEFQALTGFSEAVARTKPAVRNTVLGEWHSLVNLIVLGTKSGALDATQAAGAFRRVCEGLSLPDHSSKALAILIETVVGASEKGNAAGGPPALDLDEAVPSILLRLTGARREAFERVKELQQVPRLDSLAGSTDPTRTVAALTGLVYAALLDPQHLLVSEDPHLLTKHRFLVDSDMRRLPLFPGSGLVTSSAEPGSYLFGGFATFENVVRHLSRGGRSVQRHVAPSAPEASGPAPSETADGAVALPPSETVFRANGRLVEVYATVKDDRGRYVDDLPSSDFTISEEGKALQTVAFETRTAPVSVALLFDTTGSMQAALPALRNAALRLIGELRPIDSVAVYSFNESVTELQPFTTDKGALKRAVMRTHAAGSTALYDALVRVNLDLAGRSGKKVIVVFTDGSDNSSVLTTDTAILRAKSAGLPIYTIAQGTALDHPELLRQLAGVSKTTGGVAFAIRSPSEIRAVFEAVSQDLMHGYLITFQPPPAEGHTWHAIEVILRDMKGRKVRAREGYYPE